MNILKSPELNFERVLLLHDFLIKAYVKSGSAEEDCREKVSMYYLAIAEQLFGPNRDLTRNAIEVPNNILKIFQKQTHSLQMWQNHFADSHFISKFFFQFRKVFISLYGIYEGNCSPV